MWRTILPLGQKFWKRQYGLNRSVFSSKFSKMITWVKPYCLLVKFFLNDNMSWTILSFAENFVKRLYGSTILSLCLTLWKTQYEFNHIVFRSNFFSNTVSVWPYCIFIKSLKETIWVEPYCLLVRNFLKRQSGLNHFAITSKLSKKAVWVEPYYLLIKVF